MSAEDIRQLVALRVQQADEALADARLITNQGGSGRTVVNRAYYAAFYAVLALLLPIGEAPRKHSGAIMMFDKNYVLPGHLSRDLSKRLHRLFEMRVEDDYKKVDPVAPEDAAHAFEMAEQFVAEARNYLTSQGFLS